MRTDSRSSATIRRRLLVAVTALVAALTLSSSLATSPASAMTPAQTSVVGTVNTLFWDLDGFWRWTMNHWGRGAAYQQPKIGWYYASPSYVPQCGGNGYLYDATMMAYCTGNGRSEIWIHYGTNQSKVTRLGDYAAGFWLAHEFGHHIAKTLRLDNSHRSIAGRELYADCLAGVFTKYAHSRGRLDNRDYWEGVATIDDWFPREGTPGLYPYKKDRKNWYWYGFNSYNAHGCSSALNWVS